MSRDLKRLCKHLGYTFSDEGLLRTALTHRSLGACNNERLEYLGDGALNFIIAAELYHRKSELSEGDLSRLRANLVCGESLAKIGHKLGLGDYLYLGPGELKSGGFRRDSIIADAVEALLGAVYLDSGFDACRNLVLRLFNQRLLDLPAPSSLKDPKTRLQEYLQGRKLALPSYALLETTGKAHEQMFLVECRVESLGIESQARLTSRRRAEQAAAEALLAQIEGL